MKKYKFRKGQIVRIVSDHAHSKNTIGKIVEVDRTHTTLPYHVIGIMGTFQGKTYWQYESDLRASKNVKGSIKTIQLNDKYCATYDKSRKIVFVGCQRFTFAKIKQLAKLIS